MSAFKPTNQMKDIQDDIFISELIYKYIKGECTPDDMTLLSLWLRDEHNRELFDSLLTQENLYEDIRSIMDVDTEKHYVKLQRKIFDRTLIRRISIIGTTACALVAAAALLLNSQIATPDQQESPRIFSESVVNNDQAMLLTTNGEVIYIKDSTTEVDLRVSNSVQQVAGNQKAAVNSYNTLSTVNQSNIEVILYDGTRVKLNAHSTLRYPDRFENSNRMVQLNGEAYFEVTKNDSQPFVVKTSAAEIKVLGTEFNVNASSGDCTTTLIEGCVQIFDNKRDSVTITPGEQVSISTDKPIIVSRVNVLYDTAWTKGMFGFYDQPLEKIMEKICSWYGMEFIIDSRIKAKTIYTVIIDRAPTIEQVMYYLGLMDEFQYSIENKTIVIN